MKHQDPLDSLVSSSNKGASPYWALVLLVVTISTEVGPFKFDPEISDINGLLNCTLFKCIVPDAARNKQGPTKSSMSFCPPRLSQLLGWIHTHPSLKMAELLARFRRKSDKRKERDGVIAIPALSASPLLISILWKWE